VTCVTGDNISEADGSDRDERRVERIQISPLLEDGENGRRKEDENDQTREEVSQRRQKNPPGKVFLNLSLKLEIDWKDRQFHIDLWFNSVIVT